MLNEPKHYDDTSGEEDMTECEPVLSSPPTENEDDEEDGEGRDLGGFLVETCEDETRSYEGGSYVYIRRQYIILRVRWRDIQPAGSCSLVVSIVNGDSTTESDSRRRMESLLSSS